MKKKINVLLFLALGISIYCMLTGVGSCDPGKKHKGQTQDPYEAQREIIKRFNKMFDESFNDSTFDDSFFDAFSKDDFFKSPNEDFFKKMKERFESHMRMQGNAFGEPFDQVSSLRDMKWEENAKEKILSFELSDPKKDVVDIKLSSDQITLTGKRVEGNTATSFSQSFSLPDDVDGEKGQIEKKDKRILIRFPKINPGSKKIPPQAPTAPVNPAKPPIRPLAPIQGGVTI